MSNQKFNDTHVYKVANQVYINKLEAYARGWERLETVHSISLHPDRWCDGLTLPADIPVVLKRYEALEIWELEEKYDITRTIEHDALVLELIDKQHGQLIQCQFRPPVVEETDVLDTIKNSLYTNAGIVVHPSAETYEGESGESIDSLVSIVLREVRKSLIGEEIIYIGQRKYRK